MSIYFESPQSRSTFRSGSTLTSLQKIPRSVTTVILLTTSGAILGPSSFAVARQDVPTNAMRRPTALLQQRAEVLHPIEQFRAESGATDSSGNLDSSGVSPLQQVGTVAEDDARVKLIERDQEIFAEEFRNGPEVTGERGVADDVDDVDESAPFGGSWSPPDDVIIKQLIMLRGYKLSDENWRRWVMLATSTSIYNIQHAAKRLLRDDLRKYFSKTAIY